MHSPPRIVPLLAAALASLASLAGVARGQSDVRAWHAHGQTFVVWETGGLPAATWNVYRAPGALTHVGQGQLAGRMFNKEAVGERLKLSGTALTWRVPDGAGGSYQLTSTEGLFVFTPHAAGAEYFAVVRQGQTAVTAANRTAAAVAQGYDPAGDPVRCHEQAQLVNGAGFSYRIFAMWVDGRDDAEDGRPDFPIMANAAKNGAPHVVAIYEPTGGPVAGALPVVMMLHGGGDAENSYRRFQPGVNTEDIGIILPAGLLVVPDDVVYRVLSITPTFSVGALNTLWMGWRTNWDPYTVYPSGITLPPADSQIVNYTMRRLEWMLQWLVARSPWTVDARRISVMGASMGGGGTSLQARWRPERYASAVAFVPRMAGPSTSDGQMAQGNGVELLGSGAQNLPTNLTTATGATLGVNDVFQPFRAISATQRDFPVLRFYVGRYDDSVQWGPGRIANYQNINGGAWGAHLFWDSRVHSPERWASGDPPGQHIAEWVAPVQTALASAPYQARYRSDQSFPGFFNDDQNAALAGRQPSMGNGDPLDGDPWGTWSGYYDWEQETIADTPDTWACTLFLRGLSPVSVDNYPGATATASVSIRRPQRFQPAPGAACSWTLRRVSDGGVVQSGVVSAAVDRLVIVPALTISKDPARLRLEVAYDAARALRLEAVGRDATGLCTLTARGLAGTSATLETSTDLTAWTPVQPVAFTGAAQPLTYQDTPAQRLRHFRLALP